MVMQVADSTRYVLWVETNPAGNVIIDYVTIASLGNAVDFGDLN